MKIRKDPTTLMGFENAINHAIKVASSNSEETVCSVLRKTCKCTIVSTIDDPESLNSGFSLVDVETAKLQMNYKFYAGILLGYITAVEFQSEEDLLLFTLRWA